MTFILETISSMDIKSASIIDIKHLSTFHYLVKVGPFQPHFGHVVGYILRRMLVTYVPGYAITHAGLPNVTHEYQIADFMREDFITVLHNLKQVVISLTEPNMFDKIIHIQIVGPCVLTAERLRVPGVEVHNPGFIIAHITSHQNFQFSLRIAMNRGFGCLNKAEFESDELPLEVFPVFNPIKTCSFHIEKDLAKLEHIYLNLKTNGSIEPAQAISLALEGILPQFRVFYNFQENDTTSSNIVLEENSFDTSSAIDKLGLTVRSINCLNSIGINTVEELITHESADLLKIPNLGKKSLREIVQALQQHNLFLNQHKELL